MSFRVLGPVEVWAGDRRLALGGPRQVTLLTFLLLHANRAVSVDALIDAVWGPERNGSVKRLQMAIARLRKALEPLGSGQESVLRTVGGGYILSVGPGELDTEVFAERVRDGRRTLEDGDPTRASQLLDEALALWRGPPLAEVAFEDFAQSEIRHFEELHLTTLEARIDADLQLGRYAQIVGELEALVARHPTRERLAGQLMTALYRSGRQAEALETYQRTRSHLADQLGLEPGPALAALQMEILDHAPALHLDHVRAEPEGVARARSVADVPLPATKTIGRQRELEAVRGLLVRGDPRCVTLIGPGGVGKTRLAQVVARGLRSDFPDGVVWVDLTGVARPEDVALTVVRALALTPGSGESATDALLRYLANKRLLLAIDNFEHLLEAAGLVAQLHGACPAIAILTTSREPLNLAAEHRVVVAPLAVPTVSSATSVAELEAADASALFLAAVRGRDNQFEIAAATAPAIARICADLDGLPLALELAAARTGLLSADELVRRLDDAVADLGTGPRDAPARQRTLRATIDWSYRLLDEDQQDVFVRFSVFAGGASLDAAQAVTGAQVGTLETLVDKSLIERRRQPDGTIRLRMLETLRANALERLLGRPDRDALHRRHFEHYLALAEELTSRLLTHDEVRALAAVDSEIDNLMAALRWALDAAPGAALRLAGHLGQYWYIRGNPDALYWLEAALRGAGEGAPAQDRALAQLKRAWWLSIGEERVKCSEANEDALALYRELGDDRGLTHAYISCAMGASKVRDTEAARRYAEAACRHARIVDDDALLGKALSILGMMLPSAEGGPLLDQAADLLRRVGGYRELVESFLTAAYMSLIEGRVAEALSRLDVALSVLPKVNNPATEMFVQGNLGLAKLFSGALEEARTAFERQLRLCVGASFAYGADEGLAGLAAVLAAEGRPEQAARLRGAARAMGYPRAGIDDLIANRLEREYFAPMLAAYGSTPWRQAEQAGSELSYEEAIAFALEQSQPKAWPQHRVGRADNRDDATPATVVPLRGGGASRQR